MYGKLKSCVLIICLFVFLFVIVGNALHLTPGAAFIGALSGTPLITFGFSCWWDAQCGRGARREETPPEMITTRERT
jgi:hypothetical protein